MAKADRQRSEASAGLLVEQAGISVHPMFASRPPNSGQFAGRISPQGLTIGLVAASTRGESEAGAGHGLEVAAGLRASELPRRADRRYSVAHAGENLGDVLRPAVLAGIACPRC